MKTIKHSIKFTTELNDLENPTVKKLLELPKKEQAQLLESVLSRLLASKVDELNKRNSWATLKVGA